MYKKLFYFSLFDTITFSARLILKIFRALDGRNSEDMSDTQNAPVSRDDGAVNSYRSRRKGEGKRGLTRGTSADIQIYCLRARYRRARVSMCISSRIQLRVRLPRLPSRQTNVDRLTRRSFCFYHLA